MGLVKEILYKTASPKFLPFVKRRTIFPYYHLVGDEPVAHIRNLYTYKGVSQFTADLDFLMDHYKPLDPAELLIYKEKIKIPKNSFLLTFDDGLSEVYHCIYPALKKRGLNAIFFVNPTFIDNKDANYRHVASILNEQIRTQGFETDVLSSIGSLLSLQNPDAAAVSTTINKTKSIDTLNKIAAKLEIDIDDYLKQNAPYLTSAQIQEMIAEGFYFGGHTMTHPRLPELTLKQQIKEVTESIDWVKNKFDLDYSLFAFPFSDKGISRSLIDAIFNYDASTIIFANSGFRKDISDRIVHRFSVENPDQLISKRIITENFYRNYNKLIGKYKVTRS